MLGIFAVLKFTGDARRLQSIKAAALNGVILQMFNHGLTAATLFWFVALLEKRSGGLRGLNDFGGLRKVAPVFCGLMGIALFSSLGLPGLNGFVGEFLIFRGTFPLATWAASLAVIGLLADGDLHSDDSSACLLWTAQEKMVDSCRISPLGSGCACCLQSHSCSCWDCIRNLFLASSTVPPCKWCSN